VTTYVDGFDRPTGNDYRPDLHTRNQYDAEGRVVSESPLFREHDIRTTLDYDPINRITKRTNPDGSMVRLEYGPARVDVWDEKSRKTTQRWNAFGSPDDAWLFGITDAANSTWSYSYNTLGKIIHVVAPGSVERAWTYDSLGRLHTEAHPESGTIVYDSFDDAGNLTQKHDARETAFVYKYDDNNRIKEIDAGSRITTITYEAGSDRIESASVADVQTTFHYNHAGLLDRRVDVLPGQAVPQIQSFTYDGNDNIAQITYATGRVVSYEYNDLNQVTLVHDVTRDVDYASSFSYHPSGAIAGFTTANGLVHAFDYDEQRYWPKAIRAGDLNLTYDNYDRVGNVGAIGDVRAGMRQQFTYDALDRLTGADGGYGTVAYTYDAHGNRQTNAASSYQYDAGQHLRGQNDQVLTYDPNGNLQTTTDGGTIYTYTTDNKLETSVVSGESASYLYDADGWRVAKTSHGITSVYVRGPSGQLMSEIRPSARRDYIYAGGRLIGMIRNVPADGVPSAQMDAQFDAADPEDPGLLHVRASFSAESPVGVPLTSATLMRATTTSSCNGTSGSACAWTTVDTATAPSNVVTWSDNSSLSDTPPPGASYVYTVRVRDADGALGTANRVSVNAPAATPATFSFADQVGTALGTSIDSNIVQIAGLSGSVAVSVMGAGAYRICSDGTCSTNPVFKTDSATVANGAYLQLRATSSMVFNTGVNTTLTVGAGSDTWTVSTLAQDVTPDTFTFADQNNVATETVISSNILQVAGISGVVLTSISGSGVYRVCLDAACSANPAFTSSVGSMTNGEYLQLRLASSDAFAAGVSATMTVGSLSDTWTVATLGQDVTPEAFSFDSRTGVALNTAVLSDVVKVNGITGAVPVSISGAGVSYRVCADGACIFTGGWTTNASTVSNGQYVQMTLTSSSANGTPTNGTLTIGAGSAGWSVTTVADPCAGSPVPGTTCADGSKFAGMSPWTGTKLYMTAADYTGKVQFAWPQTVHGVHSNTDGLANTNSLSQYGNYHAADACYYLTAHGKSDWYLPAPYEWNTIDPYRQAIGGFQPDGTAYWTSSEQNSTTAGGIYHNIGGSGTFNGYTGQGIKNYVRCMRRD
jgi:YD repeat-containing protein